jgi:nicotinamide-nucleotide amidase
MPTAAIVLSGNELLDGRVRDGNGVYASADLSGRGVKVTSMMTVADDTARLTAALRCALAAEPDVLIVGGGLGTTHDDLTAACLAEVLGVSLEEDPRALAMLEDSLRGVAERRHVTVQDLLPQARRQAWIPTGSAPLAPAGVAPGIAARRGRTRIFAFPGVPHEFASMWRQVAGRLADDGFFPDVVARYVRIFGSGEPAVAAVLEVVSRDLLETGITVGGGEVTVKLRYVSTPQCATQADAVVAALEQALPVFSTDGRTVDDMIADLLGAGGESLAVAESCTGGTLGGRITGRPGSSRYFRGGVISYADAVKQEVLGVSVHDLQRYGAVSSEVAAAMAEGVRRICGASYGLSVTGVAGPGGATPEKPVGLVYVGCSGPRGTRVSRERLLGDRAAIRLHATTRALHLLRDDIASGPPRG